MAFRAAEYQRFSGRRSRLPGWWPVCTATLRRGWASLWVKLIAIAALAISFGITMLCYFAYQVMPNWPRLLDAVGESEGMGSGFPIEVYAGLLHVFVYPILLPMSLLFGYDLVAKDLASNALETYFSRPITPFGYLIGRTVAFSGFLLLVSLLPLLWFWFFDVSTGPDGRFAEIAGVPWALVTGLVPVSVVLALFIQAVSALTRSGVWTNLAVVVLFLLGSIAGQILFEESGRQIEVELTAADLAEEAAMQRHFVEAGVAAGIPEAEAAAADAPVGAREAIGLGLGAAVLYGAATGPAQRAAILGGALLLVAGQSGADLGGAAQALRGVGQEFGPGAVALAPRTRPVVHNDPRMLAVSITDCVRSWCLSRLERTYPDAVRQRRAAERGRRYHQTERMVPEDLARGMLLGLGAASAALLALRLRKRGTVG